MHTHIHTHGCFLSLLDPQKYVRINIYWLALQKNTKHVQIGLDQVTMWPHRGAVYNKMV